jgi:hypothetical protein
MLHISITIFAGWNLDFTFLAPNVAERKNKYKLRAALILTYEFHKLVIYRK